MNRSALKWIVLASAVLAPGVGSAQPPPAGSNQTVSCVRGGLQRAVNLYIEAQTKGDVSGLPLAMGLGYVENMTPVAIDSGGDQDADEDRSPFQLARRVDVPDVHRGRS